MRIFVSWSGSYSKGVAELLREWVPNVIQEAQVYVSSQDIAKGEAWPDSVRGNLSEIDLGVVVVTKTNVEAPWILFEAGALSKSVKARVIPLLCDVDHVDLAKSPLRLFQASMVTEADILAMMQSLNSFAQSPLSDDRLTQSFQKWWPDFLANYEKLKPDAKKPAKPLRTQEDGAVMEVLEVLLSDVQAIKAQNSADSSRFVLEQFQALISRYRDELPEGFNRRVRDLLMRGSRRDYYAVRPPLLRNLEPGPAPVTEPEKPVEQ